MMAIARIARKYQFIKSDTLEGTESQELALFKFTRASATQIHKS